MRSLGGVALGWLLVVGVVWAAYIGLFLIGYLAGKLQTAIIILGEGLVVYTFAAIVGGGIYAVYEARRAR